MRSLAAGCDLRLPGDALCVHFRTRRATLLPRPIHRGASQVDSTSSYQIRNEKNHGMCLGVDHGSRDRRADIRIGACNSNPDQEWTFIAPQEKPNGHDVRVNIKNSYGLCVGVERGETTRAQLKQNKCTAARDQIWYTWRVDDPVG